MFQSYKKKHTASIEFLKNDGGLGYNIDALFLNGKSYYPLERGLRTSLKEGDKVRVEIYVDVLGGG